MTMSKSVQLAATKLRLAAEVVLGIDPSPLPAAHPDENPTAGDATRRLRAVRLRLERYVADQ